MNLYMRSLSLLAVAVLQTHGSIHEDVSQLPTHTFDYIIVGGMRSRHHTTNRRDELIRDHF